MKRFILSLLFIGGVLSAPAVEWRNLVPEKRLGGRMVSNGYLRGKVVILDSRDYGAKANFEDIRKLENLWKTYKSKPFIVLGSHQGHQSPERMAAILERLGVSYPVYAEASCEDASPTAGSMRVYDGAGRCLYAGSDQRAVTGCVGAAIFAIRKPANAKQLTTLLDYEIEYLPGRAYLRLKDLETDGAMKDDLKAKYPEAAERYAAFFAKAKESNEIKKLAKLVELSRLVKDRDKADAKAQKITLGVLEKTMAKYESLKTSENAMIAQEAKNALADLKFVQATLKK